MFAKSGGFHHRYRSITCLSAHPNLGISCRLKFSYVFSQAIICIRLSAYSFSFSSSFSFPPFPLPLPLPRARARARVLLLLHQHHQHPATTAIRLTPPDIYTATYIAANPGTNPKNHLIPLPPVSPCLASDLFNTVRCDLRPDSWNLSSSVYDNYSLAVQYPLPLEKSLEILPAFLLLDQISTDSKYCPPTRGTCEDNV